VRKLRFNSDNRGLGVSKWKVFFLPGVFLMVSVMVLGLWVWPAKKEVARVKEEISNHRSEMSQLKKEIGKIRALKGFASAHGDNPLGYLEGSCFAVTSEEEIVPLLLDYLPGLGEGFYLFSWAPFHDEPKKVGTLGGDAGVDVYKVPVRFGFKAYVVEAMGFISSLKRRRGIWVDGIEVKREQSGFPAYTVRGGTCFVVGRVK